MRGGGGQRGGPLGGTVRRASQSALRWGRGAVHNVCQRLARGNPGSAGRDPAGPHYLGAPRAFRGGRGGGWAPRGCVRTAQAQHSTTQHGHSTAQHPTVDERSCAQTETTRRRGSYVCRAKPADLDSNLAFSVGAMVCFEVIIRVLGLSTNLSSPAYGNTVVTAATLAIGENGSKVAFCLVSNLFVTSFSPPLISMHSS